MSDEYPDKAKMDAELTAMSDQSLAAQRDAIERNYRRFIRLSRTGLPVDEVDRAIIRATMCTTLGEWHRARFEQGL